MTRKCNCNCSLFQIPDPVDEYRDPSPFNRAVPLFAERLCSPAKHTYVPILHLTLPKPPSIIAIMRLQEAGHGLGSPPSGRRSPGYMWMSREADLNDKLRHIPGPDSPKAAKDDHSKFWPQSSFDHREEISEASLAEGFTFQRREPPRPGQFSNIPRRASPAKAAIAQVSESLENKFASPQKDKIAIPILRPSPLDLPELCLPGKPSDIDSGTSEMPEQPKHVRCTTKGERHDI
jgi:hypothetical protein